MAGWLLRPIFYDTGEHCRTIAGRSKYNLYAYGCYVYMYNDGQNEGPSTSFAARFGGLFSKAAEDFWQSHVASGVRLHVGTSAANASWKVASLHQRRES